MSTSEERALKVASRIVFTCLAMAVMATQAVGSARFGIFAIIDDVTFEPSEYEPERVLLSGIFTVPAPVSSGLHQSPSRGRLYFSLNEEAPVATRFDWEALQAASGTGQVVGFGQYWMSCAHSSLVGDLDPDSNCSFEVSVFTGHPGLATPVPYPAPSDEGVVTDFSDDNCARFGASSNQIAFDLRKTYSSDEVRHQPPACPGSIGLVPLSESEFQQQPRNAIWASETEAYLVQRLAEAPGLELSELGIECRDTICHIRLIFPTKEYQEAAGNRLAAEALNELPIFAPGSRIIAPRNRPVTEYYFQRRLPSETTE